LSQYGKQKENITMVQHDWSTEKCQNSIVIAHG